MEIVGHNMISSVCFGFKNPWDKSTTYGTSQKKVAYCNVITTTIQYIVKYL